MPNVRVNVGCGASPTPGWVNLDSSPTVVLARAPYALSLLARAGLLNDAQVRFGRIARAHGVRRVDCSRKLPFADASVRAVYSSHMLEHLDRPAARRFLQEVLRVLVPGGVLRLGVPDLAKLVHDYLSDGDADRLVERTLLPRPSVRGLLSRVRWLAIGPRNHAWMYDGRSLRALLETLGFVDVRELPPGETMIEDPGELNLFERADETVYVEGRKPRSYASR